MLYAEHWSARPAWTALSVYERIAFLDQLGPAMDRFRASSATLIGVALRETRRFHRTDTYYVALWRIPEGESQIQALDAILESVGWSRYFDPVVPTADEWEGAEEEGTARPPTREIRAHSARNGDLRAES